MTLSSGCSFLHLDSLGVSSNRESTLRPYSIHAVPSGFAHPQQANRQDDIVPTWERPVSYRPVMASSLGQSDSRVLRRYSDCNRLGLDAGYPESISTPWNCHSQLQTTSRPSINRRPFSHYETGLGSTGRRGDRNSALGGVPGDESPDSFNSARVRNYAPSISEDGISSLYECRASDFPAPPPMTSPVIRRMRSSPWYKGDYDDSVRHISEQLWRGKAMEDDSCNLSLGTRCQEHAIAGLASSSFQTLPELRRANNAPMPEDSLEWTGKICLPGTLPSKCNQRNVTALQHAKQENFPLRYQRSLTALQPSVLMPPNVAIMSVEAVPAQLRQSIGPLGRLPRIIRKVASMRSEAQKQGSIAQPGPAANKSIPKARSFRSMLQSAEANKARERIDSASREWHRPSSWVLGHPPNIIEYSALSAQESRSSGDREDKMGRRQCFSVPASKSQAICEETGKRGSGSGNGRGGGLDAPFLHLSSANQSTKKGMSTQEQCEGPNSFMNISPDKSGSRIGSKRDRMKILLARASTSMFGWGKQRGDRKTPHAK